MPLNDSCPNFIFHISDTFVLHFYEPCGRDHQRERCALVVRLLFASRVIKLLSNKSASNWHPRYLKGMSADDAFLQPICVTLRRIISFKRITLFRVVFVCVLSQLDDGGGNKHQARGAWHQLLSPTKAHSIKINPLILNNPFICFLSCWLFACV